MCKQTQTKAHTICDTGLSNNPAKCQIPRVEARIMPIKYLSIRVIMIQKKLQYVSISVIFAMLVGAAIIPYGSIAFAEQSQNSTSKTLANTTSNSTAMTNKTALLKPG